MSDTALAVVEAGALVPAPMGDNFRRYRTLQVDIDKAMPDCIITISGRQFRKKNYWRAVGVAFGLRVECVKEERIERGTDWGYSAMYRATAKNGMSADGDGICMASEKRGGQGTEHNVRSHCHTRAYNRAISNLVGFGEVSAEEVERDDHPVITATVVPTATGTHTGEPEGLFPDDNTTVSDGPSEGFVYVADTKEVKSGSNANGTWHLWVVKFSDGREASTFDGQMVVTADAAKASHTPVIPTLEPSAKSKGKFNLTSLVRA